MTKVYFSSTSSIDEKNFDVIGCIENVNNRGIRRTFIEKSVAWCLDSGTFSKEFDENKWKRYINTTLEYKDKCSFIVIPDVIFKYKETLQRFLEQYEFPKHLGFPIAFVAQDHISIEEIPFDLFEVLFIGGSNEYKLGTLAREHINFAKSIGKKVHVGRVNSIKRLNIFRDCDSWDGTHLGFDPKDGDRFAEHIRSLNGINT